MTSTCPNCGEPFTSGRSRFCSRCGKPLQVAGVVEASPVEAPSTTSRAQNVLHGNADIYQPLQTGEKRSTRRGVHVTMFGALFGLLTFFMPWVSCQNPLIGAQTLTGADLARASAQRGSAQLLNGVPVDASPLLGLIPLAALIILALGFTRYASARSGGFLAFLQAMVGAVATVLGLAVIFQILNLKQQLGFFGQLLNVQIGAILNVASFGVTTVVAWLERD